MFISINATELKYKCFNDCVCVFPDKELLGVKERQDMELEAMRATVQEQRAQIDILRSVQAQQARMDEEVRQPGYYTHWITVHFYEVFY